VASDGTVKISEIIKEYPDYTEDGIRRVVSASKEFKLHRNEANELSISVVVAKVCSDYLASSFGFHYLFVKSLNFGFLSVMSFFWASMAE